MASAVTVRVQGDKDLIRRLEDLKRGARNRVLRPAINEACDPMLRAARARVPIDQGWLKKSLVKRVSTYRSGNVVGVVGPRTGFATTGRGATKKRGLTAFGKKLQSKTSRRPTKYAHLVEFGTKPHKIGIPKGRPVRVVNHPGARAARFMTIAWQTTKGTVMGTLARRARQELDKQARKK